MHRTQVNYSDSDSPIEKRHFTIALAGNPNAGKTSIFNLLTGLHQKTGNFPGITVEKKEGYYSSSNQSKIKIIDFPGTYSLYPNSLDERIVVQTFTNPQDDNYPDGIVYVADVTKLEQHLLLLTQLRDLGIPLVLVLNMIDLVTQSDLIIDISKLEEFLQIPIFQVSSRTGSGMKALKAGLEEFAQHQPHPGAAKPFIGFDTLETKAIQSIQKTVSTNSPYQALLVAHHYQWLPFLSAEEKNIIAEALKQQPFEPLNQQIRETMKRYDRFTPVVKKALKRPSRTNNDTSITEYLDNILTHPLWGSLLFVALMVLVFQAIYAWAAYPMEWIEIGVGKIGETISQYLPGGWFTDLLIEGILAGLGGILVFVPQIAILFFLISLLEEVGYMARAAFLFDRTMQLFGLNGRSVVALVSGGACAIPAIMSTRNIANWKERLITIMVTPLISCSARIPVYAVLVGFVVPSSQVLGIFNLQGIAFMGLYLLGIIAALLSALVFKWILKTGETSFLMLELPEYRLPVWRNVAVEVYDKVKAFVIEAGKVIFVISIILWFLASYGPGTAMQDAEQMAITTAQSENLDVQATNDLIAASKIEASYAGYIGKTIEPVIRPLGYDWKIGIALITSFAAREVFIGTMATIYSIGSEENTLRIRDRMAKEVNPRTGQPTYNLATSLSLLIFYVFAMQCMSTLAVVKRETNSWKWPIIQFLFMSGLAYLGAFLAYRIFS